MRFFQAGNFYILLEVGEFLVSQGITKIFQETSIQEGVFSRRFRVEKVKKILAITEY